MTLERTLTFIKPENEGRHVEIFAFLDDNLRSDNFGKFTRLTPLKISKIGEPLIRAHYKHIAHVPTYEDTIRAFVEGVIFTSVYSGENIIGRVRVVLGATDSTKAAQGTIRRLFGDQKYSMADANRDKKYFNNIMHASGNVEEAEREIALWLRYYSALLEN